MRRGAVSVASLLAFYRLGGGFPLHLVPSEVTTVEQDSKILWLRPIIALLVILAIYVLVVYETCDIYGFIPSELIDNVANGFGTSTFLVYILYSISTSVWLTGGISYFLFLGRRKRLSTFYSNHSRLEKMVGGKKLTPGLGDPAMLVWMGVCAVVTILGCIMYSVAGYIACTDFTNGEPMTWVRWIYIFTLALDRMWTLCNPLMASVNLICMDYVNALTDLIGQWKQALKNLSINDKNFKSKFKMHLKFGCDLCSLTEEANGTMSPFQLLSYGYFLVGGVMYSYGAFDIVFSKGDIKAQTALLSVTFVTFAFTWFYGLAMIAKMGDDLLKERDAVIKALDVIVLECEHEDLGEHLTNGWSGITRQLANIKISPYNYFEVRNSTFLTMLATISTYLIIVLQFRAS